MLRNAEAQQRGIWPRGAEVALLLGGLKNDQSQAHSTLRHHSGREIPIGLCHTHTQACAQTRRSARADGVHASDVLWGAAFQALRDYTQAVL